MTTPTTKNINRAANNEYRDELLKLKGTVCGIEKQENDTHGDWMWGATSCKGRTMSWTKLLYEV